MARDDPSQIEKNIHEDVHGLREDIEKLSCLIRQVLSRMEILMSKATDLLEAQRAFAVRTRAALARLLEKVNAINARPTWTPEDQTDLDATIAEGESLTQEVEAFESAIPTVPPTT